MRPTILHTPLLVSLAWLVACSGDGKDTGATDTGTATETATATATGTATATDTDTDTATETATATDTDTGTAVEPENQAPDFDDVADLTTYLTAAQAVLVRDGDAMAGTSTSADVATMLVELAEGEAAAVAVAVADPENGAVTLQLGGACDVCGVQAWVRLVDGTLWLTPQYRDAGDYVVYVTARDAEGATTELSFPVHVANVVRVRRVYDNYPLGGGTAVDEVHPTWSPDSTQLAFSGNPGQNADIFVMSALAGEPFTDTNQDGIRGPGETFTDLDMSLGYEGPGAPQRLTNFDGSTGSHEDIDGGAADVEPAWSPDGSTIAFATDRGDGRYRIFRMADDGSGQTVLFDGSLGRAPAWAPTGASMTRRLAYARSVSDGADLVVTDLAPSVGPGGNPELLASTPEVVVAVPAVDEFDAAWTPDGVEPARVAFVSDRAGRRALWLYTPSTGEVRALTPSGGEDARPTWSPDGTWLAFERDEGGARDVWAVDADGDGLVNLTGELSGEQREPAWSPDGMRIAYADDSGDSWDVWAMSVDAGVDLVPGDVMQLTRDEAGPAGPILRDDRAPSWAPDGGFLVFTGSVDGGAAELYRAETNGVDDIDLPVVEEVTDAAWSPDHSRLAFVRTCPADAEYCVPGASAAWVYDAWAEDPASALQAASAPTRPGPTGPLPVIAAFGAPRWSPDGRFVLYHSDQDDTQADGRGVTRLHVYDADTLVFGPVEGDTGDARDAAWLPDGAAWTAEAGSTLAFVSERSGDGAHVFVAPLTYDPVSAVWSLGAVSQRTAAPGAEMRRPSWSRDGAWLAFENATDPAAPVIEVQGVTWAAGEVDGTVHASSFLIEGAAPAWSPTADVLAFVTGGRAATVPVTPGTNPAVAPVAGVTQELDWTPPGTGAAVHTVTWAEAGHTLVLSVASSLGRSAYEARVDGTQLVTADALTATDAHERDPSVSPDGDRVVYVSDADEGHDDVWSLPLGLGAARQVTGEIGDDGVDGRPTWIDSDTVAYHSDVDGGFDIHTVGVTTASDSVLVPHHVAAVAWSSDGSGVAYVTDADGTLALCYQDLLLAEPSCYANETPELDGATDPFFAPDGRLYFASALDGDADIYVGTFDGTDWTVENLTADSTADETQPALSPDGTMLVFVSDRGREGTRGLYVIDY